MSDDATKSSNVFRKDVVQDAAEPYRLALYSGSEGVATTEARRLEIKSKISREASRRIEDSRLRAREELERAREEADELLAQARNEAGAIVERARQQEKAISDEARKQGLLHAREIARQESLDRINGLLKLLDETSREIRGLRRQFLRAANEGMAEIIIAIAERLCRGAIDVDRELVLRALREAAGAITAADRITVKLHPDDIDVVETKREEIYKLVKGLSELELRIDPNVTRGGALIETAFGRIDARLETQLAELLRAVRVATREAAIEDAGDKNSGHSSPERAQSEAAPLEPQNQPPAPSGPPNRLPRK